MVTRDHCLTLSFGLQIVGGQATITTKRLHAMWPFFNVPSASDLNIFLNLFTTIKLKEGDILFKQGTDSTGMFILADGSIEETMVCL